MLLSYWFAIVVADEVPTEVVLGSFRFNIKGGNHLCCRMRSKMTMAIIMRLFSVVGSILYLFSSLDCIHSMFLWKSASACLSSEIPQ